MSKVLLPRDSLLRVVAELERVLVTLSVEENLDGFIWEGGIAAGVEVAIRNKLRGGLVPTRYLLLSQEPVPTICRGPTTWNEKYVYLRNTATISTVSVSAFFYAHRGG